MAKARVHQMKEQGGPQVEKCFETDKRSIRNSGGRKERGASSTGEDQEDDRGLHQVMEGYTNLRKPMCSNDRVTK